MTMCRNCVTMLDSMPNISDGFAISCAQSDVRAVDPQLPHDVQNLHKGLYTLCLVSYLYLSAYQLFAALERRVKDSEYL